MRSPATVRPAFDSRLQPSLRPRLRANLRLSSAINLRRCLPTQPPTLVGSCTLRLALRPATNSRWPPILRPSPPVSFPARAFQRTLRLRLSIDLRPSSPADVPALPSDQPPACAFDRSSSSTFLPAFRLSPSGRPSGSAFEPNFPTLIGCSIPSALPPADRQLAPPIHLSALPADPTSNSPAVASLALPLG